jgi:hypothetical protein
MTSAKPCEKRECEMQSSAKYHRRDQKQWLNDKLVRMRIALIRLDELGLQVVDGSITERGCQVEIDGDVVDVNFAATKNRSEFMSLAAYLRARNFAVVAIDEVLDFAALTGRLLKSDYYWDSAADYAAAAKHLPARTGAAAKPPRKAAASKVQRQPAAARKAQAKKRKSG